LGRKTEVLGPGLPAVRVSRCSAADGEAPGRQKSMG
jgi:hypothetical protein